MITKINVSKTLTKRISCKCKCNFDGRKCNSNQFFSNDKCRCECKKRHICEKDYIWNPAICCCENGKYLASIIDNLVITCDQVIGEKTKQLQQILMKKTNRKNKKTKKQKKIYLPFD